MQYVTLVSGWKTEGVSHVVVSAKPILTRCRKTYSTYADNVVITDQPGRKGVCKLCERKSK